VNRRASSHNHNNNHDDFNNLFPPDREDTDPFASSNSDDNLDILFAPAEHTESLKQRKERKRRERRERRALMKGHDTSGTPRMKNSAVAPQQQQQQHRQLHYDAGDSHSHLSPKQKMSDPSMYSSKIESRQGTPPTSRPPKKRNQNMDSSTEDEDVWYAKWWMFCFPDTIKNMTERR